jgi:hypothetical protein
MKSIQNSVWLWDYGQGQVGVSGNDLFRPDLRPGMATVNYSCTRISCIYSVHTRSSPSVFYHTKRETEGECSYLPTYVFLTYHVVVRAFRAFTDPVSSNEYPVVTAAVTRRALFQTRGSS